jgi:hypothetical protein
MARLAGCVWIIGAWASATKTKEASSPEATSQFHNYRPTDWTAADFYWVIWLFHEKSKEQSSEIF